MLRRFIKKVKSVIINLKWGKNPDSPNAAKRSMKIFQIFQNNVLLLGISRYYSNQKYLLNRRNMSILVIHGAAIASNFVYLYHVATTFNEYADAVYICVAKVDTAAILVIFIMRMRKIFDCLNRLENITNDSEFF